MSITVTLPELSPELEKQLAAMPEEERGRFVAATREKELIGQEQPEDDGALMVGPSKSAPKVISAEAMAQLRDLPNQPREKPGENWRRAAESYKRLTGRSVDL